MGWACDDEDNDDDVKVYVGMMVTLDMDNILRPEEFFQTATLNIQLITCTSKYNVNSFMSIVMSVYTREIISKVRKYDKYHIHPPAKSKLSDANPKLTQFNKL